MGNEEKEFFSTRELLLAAVLVELKFPLAGVDYQFEGASERPIGYFKFEVTKELKDAIAKYKVGQILVEPRHFMFGYRELKSETTNVYKNPDSTMRISR